MGILDSAQDLLNRGMAATERGTRMVSLKAQLGDAERQRDKALLAFGGSVYDAAKEDASLRAGREDLFAAVEGAYRLIDEISRDILAVEDEGRAARAAAEQARAEEQARVEPCADGRAFACPACGASVEGGHRFCSSCGAPLTIAPCDAAGFASGASRESAPASEPAAVRAAAADASPAYEAAPDSGCEKLEEIAPESVTTVIEK